MYVIYIHVYMHVRCYLLKLPGNPILVITSLVFQYFRATSHNNKFTYKVYLYVPTCVNEKKKIGNSSLRYWFLLKCNFECIEINDVILDQNFSTLTDHSKKGYYNSFDWNWHLNDLNTILVYFSRYFH